jgi:hypothetical protein
LIIFSTHGGEEVNLLDKIQKAFAHRAKPESVLASSRFFGCDEEDTLWFTGRDWRELSAEDWDQHHGASTFFTHEAFAYYLPSILSLSAGGRHDLLDAGFIISSLDRSPTIAYWDENLTRRFLGLTDEEYDVLKEWLLSFSGTDYVHYGDDALTRAYETVDLLQRETGRIRRENDA